MRRFLNQLFVLVGLALLIISFLSTASALTISQPGLQGPAKINYPSHENFKYPDYFIQLHQPQAGKIFLLAFNHVFKDFPNPTIPYDRAHQFGSWINPKNDNSCLNTRGLILSRDSTAAVMTNSSCSVTSGLWQDPYTDQIFKSAQQIQIDHLVPLKHAYEVGAFEWNHKKRCLYANYTGNNFHLLAVSGHENMSKSDKAPNEYVPPNKAFTCQYLKIWLETKLIWSLRFTPRELNGIIEIKNKNNCADNFFMMDESEYQNQMTYMNDNQDLCPN